MNYEDLVKSAKNIPAAGQKTIAEYQKNMDLLVASINSNMTSRTDLKELIGKSNVNMMKNNHLNHVLFINSILKIPNPEVLVDTILWVFRTYRSHGFSVNYWYAQIDEWFHILKKQLSQEAYNEIIPLYEWIRQYIPQFEKMSSVKLEETNEL